MFYQNIVFTMCSSYFVNTEKMWFIIKILVFVLLVQTKIVAYTAADCGVVSKSEWGGVNPSKVEYLPRPVDLVIVQHTVTSPCSADSACAGLVRNLQANHMDNLGYWDIGPSFVVGGNGKVYEGAGWLRVGAHTYKYNRRSIGIAFLGNFNTDKPTPAALEAVQRLLSCGVERGHLKPTYKLLAHKQLIATESPGLHLYNEIIKWPQWLQDATSVKNQSYRVRVSLI